MCKCRLFFSLLVINLIIICCHRQMVIWNLIVRDCDDGDATLSVDRRYTVAETPQHGISNGEAESLPPFAV